MKKYLYILASLTLIIYTFAGCRQVKSPVTKSGVYFDTIVSITLYENNSSTLIDDCFELADKYENMLSKTKAGSDVYKVNNSYNEWVEVSEETYSLIDNSIKYEDYSNGRFSVMCGALTELWDISKKAEPATSTDDTIIPSENDIATAKNLCGIKTLDIDKSNHSVRINTKGAKLDLGAVAKGYIADKMKEYLVSQGVTSGIIQLGGNVLLIGENPAKPDGLYNIGISTPFAGSLKPNTENEVITAVSKSDTSIVTSGNYQRYFEYNGQIYHHIIDLTTGYPADTGLNSVTIINDSSLNADALSTVCFLLGEENAIKLLNSLNTSESHSTSAVFVDSNNQISNY